MALAAAVLVRVALPGVVTACRTTAPAVVLAHSMAAGTELQADDLKVAQVAAGLVPAGALTDPAAAVGARLTAALPAGMPLTPEVLVEVGGGVAAPSGTVAFPTRLSDPAVAGLIQPGDRIDVYASAGSPGGATITPAQELAKGALVLQVPGVDGAAGDAPGLLVLAVTETEARLLGGASSWAVITAVLVSH